MSCFKAAINNIDTSAFTSAIVIDITTIHGRFGRYTRQAPLEGILGESLSHSALDDDVPSCSIYSTCA